MSHQNTPSKKFHNFNVPIVDTDAITICKQDNSEFTKEEIEQLTIEINQLTPELINWDFEFYIPKIIAIKAKNYVLWDGIKKTIKGSSLKATTKCPALKEFINNIIDSIIQEKYNYKEIYNKYVMEILNIKTSEDIRRWAAKKTITEKIYESERTNEAKVRDAIEDEESVQEGDKIYVYYRNDDSLSLVDNYNNDHNVKRLLKNLYDTAKIFSTIIEMDNFINYSLKKNESLLDGISTN